MPRSFRPALLACSILAVSLSSADTMTEQDMSGSAFHLQTTAVNKVADEIERLADQVARMEDQQQLTEGAATGVYVALGIIATGIANNVLLTHLQPVQFPFTRYQDFINSSYIRAALTGLIHYSIPAVFSGAWLAALAEAGEMPTLPPEETFKPILFGTTVSGLLSLTHTLIANLTPRSLISIPFQRSPDTVTLFNTTVMIASTSLYFLWERMDREKQYHQLQLQLHNLRRQASRLTHEIP